VIVPFASGVLPWLLPPVFGALVGGALGAFAFGPFALSMVFRNRSAISRTAASGVEAVTRWALALRVGELAPAAGSTAAASLELALADSLASLLRSRAAIYAVRDFVSKILAGLAAKKVSDVPGEIGLMAFLEERLLPALGRVSSRQAVARAAGTLVAEQAGEALRDEVLKELSGVFQSYVPEASDALVRWLRSGETRAYLSERARELLPRILEKLSDLQKLFISAGQFDRRLNEKMPEIVDDTIEAAARMARDPHQQQRIVGLFVESAQDWRDSLLVTPPDAARPWNEARQKLADSASSLLDHFLERLEDPRARRSLAGRAEAWFTGDRRTVGAFISEVFGTRDTEIAEMVAAQVLEFLVRPETARELARHLCGLLFSFIEAHAQETVAAALRVDERRKRALDEALVARAPSAVEALLPAMSMSAAGGVRRVSAAVGAGMGLAIGVLFTLLRLLGYH
jgi:hypothetical protein